MGLLNRDDARIYRKYFKEMTKLIGISVGYQYIVDSKMTIYSEDNSTFSTVLPLDILFDENPDIDTIKRLGWDSELLETKPIIAYLPFDTPNLTVNARLLIHSVDAVDRTRVFRISKLKTDFEYPQYFVAYLVPVYDQYMQKNKYDKVNNEKVNQEASENTDIGFDSSFITGSFDIDTTPQEFIDEDNDYNFINDHDSPYSG